MPTFRELLSGETTTVKRLLIAAVVLTVVGIAIIAVGVFAEWGPTRFFGAGLISAGGIIGGVAVGFSEPLRGRLGVWMGARRLPIGIIVAIIVGGPAVVATITGALGPLTGGGDASDTFLVVVGALLGLLLAAATIAAAVIAVLAIQRRAGVVDEADGNAEEGHA
ncbi:MAG TPA: hypothetical protein VHA53_08130 [Nitrolancea sp.]|nr:hypothetical protein [Nitrolancea sp.]